ncbi:MAG: Asp-tRNA(Asn)/Glu-tRNA(Gln) amidotransferase subunit GatA [Alphaproteobacteria bacterium]|nr:Asp-tRNA(Asn)/Glu-tRNA(Gln) amidotransferase subunit GatA [Alphaproteobacteria bacterium]MBT4020394.1 Asp-tRNA(Asn)/Glu-tRNA(Gln) amidotransferase subunit GatA [Alphaproteobacteria bacterium]MBT5160363.1 Asp-tRNA(Asn)/Glu-tRNA(Gln) amidotransferase subunit GatA [Alphaproteobacteria bacterium]MBT5917536.1 Asp-tRNA(Asn)/Glu-tRNA(Gln) amidotransferase subunit GatA [Alphaproteobacteria bacterium]MBT6387273.1 Asp-tRNA(Asn)/Glu-tRNA(Gln) amidotransferase subunit GatA [Alphaproteobacteria bacterium
MTDLARMTISELGDLIQERKVSPVEVVQATLDRVDRLNGGLNAFISVYPDLAMEAARKATSEIQSGNSRGPLHGVPLGIKDLFEVEGMTRTCGSNIMQEPPAEKDATSVARLKDAGAIVIGLLNLNEFAYGATGINIHKGSARNPWDRDSACGGSSAGSGCAVAAQLVPGAMGTDTGGSVRLPAAICGVVGLKQTFGLASRQGIYPLCNSFDHPGPLTRTVRDTALMLQAFAGEDPLDPTTRVARTDDYSRYLGKTAKGLKVGVPKAVFFDDLHPDVEKSVRAAIQIFTDLGAEVREIDLPFAQSDIDNWNTMALAEAFVVHEGHMATNAQDLAPEVSSRLELGRNISARDYLNARDHQMELQHKFAAFMEDFDVLAMPTAPIPAVSIKTGTVDVQGRQVEGAPIMGRLTRMAVFTGQPAISVPCGFTETGLPVGLQLVGHWFGEAALLGVADAYEQATLWHTMLPPDID